MKAENEEVRNVRSDVPKDVPALVPAGTCTRAGARLQVLFCSHGSVLTGASCSALLARGVQLLAPRPEVGGG